MSQSNRDFLSIEPSTLVDRSRKHEVRRDHSKLEPGDPVFVDAGNIALIPSKLNFTLDSACPRKCGKHHLTPSKFNVKLESGCL